MNSFADIVAEMGGMNNMGHIIGPIPKCRCAGGCRTVVSRRGEFCTPCGREEVQSRRRIELAQAWSTVPNWTWARFGDPILLANVAKNHSERMYETAECWAPKHGSLSLMGFTGACKTSLMVAVAARMLEAAMLPEASSKAVEMVSGIRFINAADLASAARGFPLRGENEVPLVQEAIDASILFLDDLGHEDPKDRSVWRVYDARYRKDLKTVMSTRLTHAELGSAERYGEDGRRRILESGVVADMGAKK